MKTSLLTLFILLAGLSCSHSQAQTHASKFNWHLDIDRSTTPPTLNEYCLEYYWRDSVALEPHEWICYKVEKTLNKNEEAPSN